MAQSYRSLASTIVLLLVCCFVAPAWGTSQQEERITMDRFHRWMEEHGKSYPTVDEKLRRFEVYRQNVEDIEATNRQGGLSYTLGENQFTDLTSEEFLSRYTGRFVMPLDKPDDEEDDDDTVITTRAGNVVEGHGGNLSAVPESVDWREKGAVTPVKNQGECGSCWAFAGVAAVESLNQIMNGKLVDLSEQQILDCGFYGCDTGRATGAITWIWKNGGITSEADYPYTGQKGACDKTKLKHHAVSGISGFSYVNFDDEQKLMEAVAKQPATAIIEVAASFARYKSGVYSGSCGHEYNHIVTIVGYGKEASTGKKYWIVKNSYGTSFGMDGYILMERGVSDPRGLCGLAHSPAYPRI